MVYETSPEARAKTREWLLRDMGVISFNIIELERELLDKKNWFARKGIRDNIIRRKAQLAHYKWLWNKYEIEGWI